MTYLQKKFGVSTLTGDAADGTRECGCGRCRAPSVRHSYECEMPSAPDPDSLWSTCSKWRENADKQRTVLDAFEEVGGIETGKSSVALADTVMSDGESTRSAEKLEALSSRVQASMGPIPSTDRRTGQRSGKRRCVRRSMVCIVLQNCA